MCMGTALLSLFNTIQQLTISRNARINQKDQPTLNNILALLGVKQAWITRKGKKTMRQTPHHLIPLSFMNSGLLEPSS